MTPQTEALPTSFPNAAERTTIARVPEITRLFWCIRRELWENRSIYIAPLGDLRTPTIADVFVAFVGQPDHQPIPPFRQPPAAPSSYTGAAQ